MEVGHMVSVGERLGVAEGVRVAAMGDREGEEEEEGEDVLLPLPLLQ